MKNRHYSKFKEFKMKALIENLIILVKIFCVYAMCDFLEFLVSCWVEVSKSLSVWHRLAAGVLV